MAPDSSSPDELVLERDALLRSLAALTPIEREALLLVAWDGLLPAQAAEVAGCSVTAFKVRLRGKDGAPLSMQEIRDGLYETARRLQKLEGAPRAKWVTLYVTMIDEDGKEVLPDPSGAWDIFPYKCAADELGA